jgi:hypothetical protein
MTLLLLSLGRWILVVLVVVVVVVGNMAVAHARIMDVLLDPLSEEYHTVKEGPAPLLKPINFPNHSSLPPPLEYLGLLVDGGRHFFPIPWLHRLLDYMYILRFNLIHLRLTDDQVFNIQLKSHPDLAFGSIVQDTRSQNGNNSNAHSNFTTYPVVGSAAYTPHELRELVHYAKARNITIMPEINVPGHGGAWAGIQGMIVECPLFICQKGYGVPLNVSHPKFVSILTDLLREVLDIFENPPLLHLGGDEVHMSKDCIDEVLANQWRQQQHRNPQNDVDDDDDENDEDSLPLVGLNYTSFEQQLQNILQHDLGYPESQVLRWERTDQSEMDAAASETETTTTTTNPIKDSMAGRAGKLLHFWETFPGRKMNATAPYFVSHGLYMDTNVMDGAWMIHHETRNIFRAASQHDRYQEGIYLKGIIVGTFELGPDFFVSRNILGRLLAVSMGVYHHSPPYTLSSPGMEGDLAVFERDYNRYCLEELNFPEALCHSFGRPLEAVYVYQEEWKKMWSRWKEGICVRTTGQQGKLHLRENPQQYSMIMENVYEWYWKEFAESPKQPEPTVRKAQQSSSLLLDDRFQTHDVEHVGIILDLVNSMVVPDDIISILNNTMAPLNLNFLQLRLVDDYGFSMRLVGLEGESSGSSSSSSTTIAVASGDTSPSLYMPRIYFLDRLAHVVKHPFKSGPYSNENLMHIVAHARTHGIQVMPEVAISTNVGGWFNGGLLLDCPTVLCESNGAGGSSGRQPHHFGMTHNVTNGSLLPLLVAVIRQLQGIFSSSSGYIHLGADERGQAFPCVRESGLTWNQTESDAMFDDFERRLSLLLELQKIYNPSRILRWNNAEQIRYPTRTGRITHYRSTDPPPPLTVQKENRKKPEKDEETFFATVNLLDPDNKGETGGGADGAWAIYQKTITWVRHKPQGLVAEIRAFGSPEVWNKFEYSQRLVAFALATTAVNHQNPIQDHAAFVKVYVPLCTKLLVRDLNRPEQEASSSCLEFAQKNGSDPSKMPSVSTAIMVEQDVFRERACQLMTKMEYKPMFRDKALSTLTGVPGWTSGQ